MSTDRLPSSVGNSLEIVLADDPQREAVVGTDRRLTYAELDTAADLVAATLHEWGLRQGDRVAVSLPNTSDIVILFHAAMRIGAVWVGVNSNLGTTPMQFILDDSGAQLLLASGKVLAGLDAAMIAGTSMRELPRDLPELENTPTGREYPRPTDLFDAPAGIAYTSGTTGQPKGWCTLTAISSYRAQCWSLSAVTTPPCGEGTVLRSPSSTCRSPVPSWPLRPAAPKSS